MIKRLLFSKFSGLLILVNLVVFEGFAALKTFSPNLVNNTGVWSSGADWSPIGIPNSSDNVIIPAGKTCILDIAITRSGQLTIQSGGVLDVNQNLQQTGSANIDVEPGGIFDVSDVRLTLQSSVFTGILTVNPNTELHYSGAIAGTQIPALSNPNIRDLFISSVSNVNLSGSIRVNGQLAVGFGSALNVLSHRLAISALGFSPGDVNFTPGASGSELEIFGNLPFSFEGGSLKSLICSNSAVVTITGNTSLASQFYIESGSTVAPNPGVSITPSGAGFTLVNKGTYNPSLANASLNLGNGLLDNRGTFFHSGSQTFQNVSNTGTYKILNVHTLTVTQSFTNGSLGQFNPDNNNPTVTITISGTNVLSNAGKFWGKGNTTINLNSTPLYGFVNQVGGYFVFEGTINCQTGLQNLGSFDATNGQISIPGSGVTLFAGAPINIGRLSNSGTSSMAGNSTVNVYDVLNVTAGTMDLAGKNLVLKSTLSKTARVAAIAGVLANATNVTQERYVNGTSSGWYFMGTFIAGQSFSDWTDDYDIRGPFPEATIPTSGDHSSIFVYDGMSPPMGGNPNVEVNGWRLPVTGNVELGKGYRSNIPSKFFTGDKIVDNTGTLNQGPFSFNPTFDPAGYGGGGWNFLANPYPAALDWNSAGWTKSSINSAIYVFNGATGQYGAYVPLGGHVAGTVYAGTNGVTSMLPSGQAFFVKANGPTPVLNATEGVKATASGTFIRSAVPNPTSSFRMALLNKSGYKDENIIRFEDEGTVDFDGQMDAFKMTGSVLNLSSLTPDGSKLCINTLPYFNSDGFVLPLNIGVNQPETYQLAFSDFEAKAREMILLLHDKYLNTVSPITESLTYSFSVTSDPNSQGSGRFEIILGVDKGVAIKIQDKKPSLITYPNPSLEGNLNVKLVNARPGDASIRIVDALGKEVLSQLLDPLRNYDFTMPCRLMPGIYFLEVTTGSEKLKTKVLVKE